MTRELTEKPCTSTTAALLEKSRAEQAANEAGTDAERPFAEQAAIADRDADRAAVPSVMIER
jgi:hypothetical protein